MNKNRIKNKILLVDDDEVGLQALGEDLNEANLHFDIAHDGRTALKKLKANPDQYGAIVLDWIMPDLDGFEVLTKLKRSKALKNIPVIMLTCVDKTEDILDAVKAGIFDYLIKPADKTTLIELITVALKK